ncbi:putative mRNA (2'-O-methyladenosine-N(6)-)-methyltransferase [Rosa chinensis]|uniref:Putative mRNA (2'-O-methyladenosine-N(6)-)-methyltransferase n=1 Tax=Rosa chinensis TaxID=74649 RepID=A0A2P6PYI8_ROSCH|nr:methyltransferase-like protein 2 isoform X2 [Rosa chinensis]PRQ26990.1 putative mRNA (2'-O-methyladenosine-N(6)-)-methyltransferase [Rosa chinensis]
MEHSKTTGQLTEFLDSGIYRFEDSNAVFIDPVRVLNRSYTRFRVSPSAYYCRRFNSTCPPEPSVASNSRKRKRKEKKKPRALNDREQVADQRHQLVRPFLLKAHESLIRTSEVLEVMSNLRGCLGPETSSPGVEQSFVELAQVWQAPLYQITLNFHTNYKQGEDGGSLATQDCEQCVLPVFNNLVVNESSNDVEAEVLTSRYILPPKSSFYMSDMGQIHNLIPAESDFGFSVIVVDPPWENGSARQKSRYKTLPNRYFLSIPIKQLCHTDGAFVALWVTNREKLRDFVEKELFPAWGVTHVATFFWLKVKADGSLICDLDLFHHRPYECLLVGICHGKVMNSKQLLGSDHIPDNQIILSVPGDYSRKPPIGGLLQELAPRLKGGRSIELFAREMTTGWVSWGNEPLHFQESRNFVTE